MLEAKILLIGTDSAFSFSGCNMALLVLNWFKNPENCDVLYISLANYIKFLQNIHKSLGIRG